MTFKAETPIKLSKKIKQVVEIPEANYNFKCEILYVISGIGADLSVSEM